MIPMQTQHRLRDVQLPFLSFLSCSLSGLAFGLSCHCFFLKTVSVNSCIIYCTECGLQVALLQTARAVSWQWTGRPHPACSGIWDTGAGPIQPPLWIQQSVLGPCPSRNPCKLLPARLVLEGEKLAKLLSSTYPDVSVACTVEILTL